MNWKEIKEKCPRAFKFYTKKYGFVDTEIAQNNLLLMLGDDLDRRLYDFFDEQGIIIDIAPTFSKKVNGKTEFYIDWWIDDMPAAESNKNYKTRAEAEEQAFIKAFEILENKL